MSRPPESTLDAAIANTRAHLLSLRNEAGHWEGELSSSALATATAVVALSGVDAEDHAGVIDRGARWLMVHQNEDGGWGDTTISKSNLSTTLLCWSALTLVAKADACRCPDEVVSLGSGPLPFGRALNRCEAWIRGQVGSLEPEEIKKAVVGRYGKDKTFSVPILMLCAICGTLGREGWKLVLPLPFELAALPRTWFGAVGLPVVSYALPALIAIGHARFVNAPPALWNPLRWLRGALWKRIRPMLKTLQPSTGGYLEATPLTSFVTMALAGSGDKTHPCAPDAVGFLRASQRADGAWPIDTNLATWATTLSVKALYGDGGSEDQPEKDRVKKWLLVQQYKRVHPFTNAAPGGWAWTDLPGGVPDADDTSGALIALWHLCETDAERQDVLPAVEAGIAWLLDLQNRDGGMPTFCRGWGTLPFDRSTPEITAHALLAYDLWNELVGDATLRARLVASIKDAVAYLNKTQRADGSWVPLWFGNENAPEEDNPVHGTAMVVVVLAKVAHDHSAVGMALHRGTSYLLDCQGEAGGWGGAKGVAPTIEETANVITALAAAAKAGRGGDPAVEAMERGVAWLVEATKEGTEFAASPIGLYFARLWYHEKMYPVIWTLGAMKAVSSVPTGRRN